MVEFLLKAIDLIAKIAIPVVIFLATYQYNSRQSSVQAEQNCIDLQIRVFQLACIDSGCTVSSDRASQLIGVHDLVKQRCEKGGLKPSNAVERFLADSAKQSEDVSVAARLTDVVKGAPRRIQSNEGDATDLAKQTSGTAAPAGQAPVQRVFIQIAEETQRVEVARLIGLLRDKRLDGLPFTAHGPELVPQARVAQTEVRCLKKQDCDSAAQIASYLGQLLGSPVAVRDISARYETDKSVRPNTYELWFAPGQIFRQEASSE